MTEHLPVRTAADLATLDSNDLLQGFLDGGQPDCPPPGSNRSRGYWHGWRVRQMDRGLLPIDEDHRALVRDIAPNGVLNIADDRNRP